MGLLKTIGKTIGKPLRKTLHKNIEQSAPQQSPGRRQQPRPRGPVGIQIVYDPLPSQLRFHDSEARFKTLCGPVGTGKSLALCQEAVSLAFSNPGRLGLIGAPTFPMLRDATQRQFFEICDGAGLRYEFHRAENRVRLVGGSEVIFRSLDNFERLRGPNLAWFGIDELTYTEPEAWLRLEARLRDAHAKRLCGFGVFTPKGFDWVYRKFATPSAAATGHYELIQAAPFENRHVLDAVPDFYERLRHSYDARFYEQEVLGQFLNVRQGRAYYAFSRQEHVREMAYDPALPIHWTWDFNVSPMCSLICQRRPQPKSWRPDGKVSGGWRCGDVGMGGGDEVWVLDEIVLPTSSTPEVCGEFMSRYGGLGRGASHGVRRKLFIYGDASGAASRSVTGRSDYQVIREFFRAEPEFDVRLLVPSANPPVRDRVNTVNARLANAAGERQVFVDPRCRELIADLEQVVYKAGSTQIDKDRDSARTHASDALGYYLCQAFSEPVGERTQRLI